MDVLAAHNQSVENSDEGLEEKDGLAAHNQSVENSDEGPEEKDGLAAHNQSVENSDEGPEEKEEVNEVDERLFGDISDLGTVASSSTDNSATTRVQKNKTKKKRCSRGTNLR